MNDDRSWLKNPILPRPPAVPRFSAAELSLVEEERESGVHRVAARVPRGPRADERREPRVSGTSEAQHADAPALAPRRTA